MTRNEQRRQKKLADRKARRKEEHRMQARVQSSGLRGQMEAAQRWPIVQARVSARIWKNGIGEALLVRRGPGGMTAFVLFLLDVYCLGVKNVIAEVKPDHTAANWLSEFFERSGPWEDVAPEHVRKLVEDSIGYALSLGLTPHRECAEALLIFGDLDSSQCATGFTFGDDGQPHYIAGPHDSAARIRDILATLLRTCGPDGFHYTIPLDGPELPGELADVLNDPRARITGLDEAEDADVRTTV